MVLVTVQLSNLPTCHRSAHRFLTISAQAYLFVLQQSRAVLALRMTGIGLKVCERYLLGN